MAPVVVWINELHYDNDAADQNEGVEIAGTAGTNLAGYELLLLSSGGGGTIYDTETLSGTIPSQQAGLGVIWFPIAGIQNGDADGVALVDPNQNVVQFLSYEGTFTAGASAGPVAGMTSTDIGVEESTTETVGHSLQLQGTGSAYADFTWATPATATPNALNNGQTFQ